MDPYITSGQFIIDDLRMKAEDLVLSLYEMWRQDRKINPVLITWPAERITAESGEPHEGPVVLEMTMPAKDWPTAMRAMIERTKAYALLLVEQRKSDVMVILESSHGATSWLLPIKNHGGLRLLGDAERRDNTESVGLLWRPRVAQS